MHCNAGRKYLLPLNWHFLWQLPRISHHRVRRNHLSPPFLSQSSCIAESKFNLKFLGSLCRKMSHSTRRAGTLLSMLFCLQDWSFPLSPLYLTKWPLCGASCIAILFAGRNEQSPSQLVAFEVTSQPPHQTITVTISLSTPYLSSHVPRHPLIHLPNCNVHFSSLLGLYTLFRIVNFDSAEKHVFTLFSSPGKRVFLRTEDRATSGGLGVCKM